MSDVPDAVLPAAPVLPPTPSQQHEPVDPGPIEATLAGIDAALARLDAGTYGTCEVCGDALADSELGDDPLARSCAGHLPGTVD